jgi:hypothetical protein
MAASRADLLVLRDQAVDELRRADTKATTLLSLVGATLAGTIALSNRAMPPAAAIVLWSAMAPIGVSVVFLLGSIRPHLARRAVPGTWLYAAEVGPSTLAESCGLTGNVTATASEVCEVSRLARKKFRHIGYAVMLLGCGLAALALSLFVAAVAS